MTPASSKDSSERTHVSFDDQLTVRYYPTVLGDNPSVKEGPPISIGWEFTTEEKLSLNETPESHKSTKDYHLDAPTRIDRLVKNGVSQKDMDAVYAEIYFLQRLRRINAAISRSSPASFLASEAMESSCSSVETEIMDMEEFLWFEGKAPTTERSRTDEILFTRSSSSIPRSKSLPRRTRSSDLTMLSSSAKSASIASRFQPLRRVNTAILRKASAFTKGACLKARGQKPQSSIPRAA